MSEARGNGGVLYFPRSPPLCPPGYECFRAGDRSQLRHWPTVGTLPSSVPPAASPTPAISGSAAGPLTVATMGDIAKVSANLDRLEIVVKALCPPPLAARPGPASCPAAGSTRGTGRAKAPPAANLLASVPENSANGLTTAGGAASPAATIAASTGGTGHGILAPGVDPARVKAPPENIGPSPAASPATKASPAGTAPCLAASPAAVTSPPPGLSGVGGSTSGGDPVRVKAPPKGRITASLCVSRTALLTLPLQALRSSRNSYR